MIFFMGKLLKEIEEQRRDLGGGGVGVARLMGERDGREGFPYLRRLPGARSLSLFSVYHYTHTYLHLFLSLFLIQLHVRGNPHHYLCPHQRHCNILHSSLSAIIILSPVM